MDDRALDLLLCRYAADHLSPTLGERAMVKRRYGQLQEYLRGQCLQSGSYARYTSTTPVNDLDVIYVLPAELLRGLRAVRTAVDVAGLDLRDIIASLGRELERCYGSAATIKAQPHSVGVYFGSDQDFSLDVVPAVPVGEMFWVPEIARHSVGQRRAMYLAWGDHPPAPEWILSHPKGYIAQAIALDARTTGKFRKAAKLLKKWRWHCKCANSQFRFKSFHLEIALTHWHRERPEMSCVEAVREVVGNLHGLLQQPQFPDLANPAVFVDQYITSLTPPQRQSVVEGFARAQALWADVEAATTEVEATRALQRFLAASPVGLSAQVPTSLGSACLGLRRTDTADPGEMFLSDDGIPVRLQYPLRIDADVYGNGAGAFRLRSVNGLLPRHRDLTFFIVECAVPPPYQVLWKVKNRGAEARQQAALRGHIYRDEGDSRRSETTAYWGKHYVECYILKEGVCVAADHLEVPIGTEG